MDARLQRRVQRYGWDAAADRYEPGWAAGLKPAHDQLLDMAELAPGQRVLEVACGTGLVTVRAAKAVGPEGIVLATDISSEMAEATARRAQAEGHSNIKVRRMEAESLTIEEGSCDRALCALGLMYVPEPGAALAAMRRALVPGGRAVAAVWGERRNCGWAELFPIVDAVVQSEVCPLFFGLGAPGALGAVMGEAGLHVEEERRLSTELNWPDAPSMLAAMIDGGAVALAAKRMAPTTRERVGAEFLDSVSAYRRDDGSYAVPGEFVTVAAAA